VAELAANASAIAAFNCVVVVMSFNPNAAVAQRWDAEVGSPFEHVFSAGMGIGEPGPLYRELGFRRSFTGVWGPKSLNFYAEQKLEGRELHPSLGQDVHMLGGDLLIDQTGRCALPYYSRDNRDRPSMELLLQALAQLHQANAQDELASVPCDVHPKKRARSQEADANPAEKQQGSQHEGQDLNTT
jgi:hypothetical protein